MTRSYNDLMWNYGPSSQKQKRLQGFVIYSVLQIVKDVNEKVRLAMQNKEINIDNENTIADFSCLR